jgi:hypothetical protein
MNLYALMAASAVFGGSLALVGCFVSHVLRTFGWDALFVKGAALFDGMLIVGDRMSLIGRLHPLPHTIPHYSVRAFDLGCLAALLYLVLFDRPTRWLLNPFVKYALYGMWLSFVVVHGIREG